MLLTIICVILLVLGYVLVEKFDIYASIPLFVIGIVGTLLCIIFALCIQIPKQSMYEQKVMRREMLEYRLEHKEDDLIGNELLYSDILDFNQSLYSTKKWCKNPWVNWFWNDKIAELDYIDVEKDTIENERAETSIRR